MINGANSCHYKWEDSSPTRYHLIFSNKRKAGYYSHNGFLSPNVFMLMAHTTPFCTPLNMYTRGLVAEVDLVANEMVTLKEWNVSTGCGLLVHHCIYNNDNLFSWATGGRGGRHKSASEKGGYQKCMLYCW